jgi:hypothetical protein
MAADLTSYACSQMPDFLPGAMTALYNAGANSGPIEKSEEVIR